MDRSNFLERVLELVRTSGVRYCLIGGTAVNAYAYPVVTQDLDIVVAADRVENLVAALAARFTVKEFPHSINVSAPDSKLLVQIQKDERYFEFLDRAVVRDVMDFQLPVARIDDLLQGKVWAALDSTRRPSKQLKDLSDIARILEVAPELRSNVPPEILSRIPTQLE